MIRHTVLLVEDSRFFGQMVRRRIETELDLTVFWVETMAEALDALNQHGEEFLAALMGLNLPDAPGGELVEHVTDAGIPSIVFTATFDEETRDRITDLGVADYVLKEHPDALDSVLQSLRRFKGNPDTKILVVDDSPTAVAAASKLLTTHRYNVLTAQSAQEALDIMEADCDIRLVLTDYNMPGMDGFELTRVLRSKMDKDRLGIIGLSAQGDNALSARFIKHGANDFLNKPYLPEELYCRVVHTLEMLEHIEMIRDLSYRDHLTRLPNRRWFFEMAESYMQQAKAAGNDLSLAMIDIDHFKHVNDTYGHDAGDLVLQEVAHLVAAAFPEKTNLPARFGGEEFAVLTAHDPETSLEPAFEGLRRAIESTAIEIGATSISVTTSIGMCKNLPDSLHEGLKSADDHLYTAKRQGRNRLVADTCRLD